MSSQPTSEPWIVSGKPATSLSVKSIITTDLFGKWQHVGSSRQFLIANNSFYYIIGDPTPYTVNATTLDMDGWVWNRLHGSGTDLIGVWQEPNTGEELNFRADLSFGYYDPDPTISDTFGTYETSTGPDLLTMTEARALLIESGNQLTFDAIFSGIYTYDFTVDATDLVLTDPSSGDVIAYTRLT